MKAVLRWLGRVAASALTFVLIIVLLPYVSRIASAVMPDLSGAALNTSLLLSHQMEASSRLETAVIEDEGLLNSTTNAMFIGQVQSVSIKYTYRASIGVDLSKVQMKVRGNTITLMLPEVEILADSITPDQVSKDDFWYPLTEERRKKLLDDELALCRERCLNDYAASQDALDNTISAVESTVSGWLKAANSNITIRYQWQEKTE
ncbi:MAG: DUF4230 domain-containing protein [Clostridiales bacterium]|nr:DUF4230 domain-containing protein [Clostridiales bacterium]